MTEIEKLLIEYRIKDMMEDTIVYEDKEFTDLIKDNKDIFMNRNMKSFIGYALGQTKKFGIKGARYDELDKFVKYIKTFPESSDIKMEDLFESISNEIAMNKFNYIKFIDAPGPKGSGIQKDITYLTVLGKMFSGSLKVDYFISRVEELYNQFGNRTVSTAKSAEKHKELVEELKLLRYLV